jgi:DNA-binding IscR family transcriptional regulator
MTIFFLMAIVMIVFAIIERNLTHTRCTSKNNNNETNEKCNSKTNDQCKDDKCKLVVEKDHSVTIGLSIGGIVSLAIGISLIFLVKHFKKLQKPL